MRGDTKGYLNAGGTAGLLIIQIFPSQKKQECFSGTFFFTLATSHTPEWKRPIACLHAKGGASTQEYGARRDDLRLWRKEWLAEIAGEKALRQRRKEWLVEMTGAKNWLVEIAGEWPFGGQKRR